MQIIPVFRITPHPEFLGHPKAASQLAAALKPWRENQASEIQLDFDCPDRVIVKYARFLQEFGKAVFPTKISITALADWPKHPDFELLAESVSSFSPMFYDIAADQPELVMRSEFQPMADAAIAARISRWADCPKPWLAGLPNFERLSIFLDDGKLSGHVRGWTHDGVIFNRALRPTVLDHGTTLYEVTAPLGLSGTQVIPGQKIVHRMPARKLLAELVSAADRAGAKGIIYFTLPGPGLQATYSPGDLARIAESGSAVLAVSIGKNGAVTLTNTGHVDLPCRPGTQEARGWALEIQSEHAGAFRSASPGAFAEIQTPDGTPPEFSRTILLRFSKLSSGAAVFSGPLVQEKRGLKWRVRGAGGVYEHLHEFR